MARFLKIGQQPVIPQERTVIRLARAMIFHRATNELCSHTGNGGVEVNDQSSLMEPATDGDTKAFLGAIAY